MFKVDYSVCRLDVLDRELSLFLGGPLIPSISGGGSASAWKVSTVFEVHYVIGRMLVM